VTEALNTIDGIADIVTNPKDRSCSFSAPADLDVEAVLNKFQDEGHKHISGWSKAGDDAPAKAGDDAPAKAGDDAPAKEDGAATSKKSGTQTVSLKLPGMT
jgi:hypothetical protein